jgi:hypothetical protein
MESKITFSGLGPYDLPASHSSRASPLNETVVLHFRVLIDPTREEVVRIAIPNNQALDLAGQIAKAAAAKS